MRLNKIVIKLGECVRNHSECMTGGALVGSVPLLHSSNTIFNPHVPLPSRVLHLLPYFPEYSIPHNRI